MPMTLYNNDLSPFTTRIRIQIRAKGLENEIVSVDRPAGDAYLSVNPIGKVPSLDTNAGFVLPESETIAEYIEDCYPEPPMRGHTALSKAKVRLLSRIADLYLMPAYGELFGQLSPKARDEAKAAESLQKLEKALGYVETYLEGTHYAVDKRLTLADCALMPVLFFSNTVEPAFGRKPFQGFDRVGAYFTTISAEDVQCVKARHEMAAALQKMMASRG